MLFIMEWGVVHIGAGCSFERNYGETFHRNCYYRGKGIGFPFYQYWVFVCQMNYTHSVSSSTSKEWFFLKDTLKRKQVYFCWGLAFHNSVESLTKSDAPDICESSHLEQGCHTQPPSIMDWARASQQARPPRILRPQTFSELNVWKHLRQCFSRTMVNHPGYSGHNAEQTIPKLSAIKTSASMFFPTFWSTTFSLYPNTAFLTFLAWEIFTFCPFSAFFAATSF